MTPKAAWQAVQAGLKVNLYEMRPLVQSPAHETAFFGELICSNSLGSTMPERASGMLKEELRVLDSLLLRIAEETALPAGSALAVDRNAFAEKITETLENHPNIHVEYLPAYAPELNPEEYCHGNVKRRMKNAVLHSKAEIRSSLDQGFARLRKRPDILLGCFQHAGLKLNQLW